MKSSKIAVNQINNVQMPEAVRNAFEVAVNVTWVTAQKMAHKNAEAASRLEIAAFKNRMEEMAAANAVQAETILDLRRKIADDAVKGEAADSAAREAATMAGRELAAMTDKAARAVYLAEKTAAQFENWRSRWRTIQISVQALFAEIDAGQQEHGVQCERLDICPSEDERGIQPIVAAKGVCTEGDGRFQREEADCIAAAIVLFKAAARYCRHQCSLRGGQNGPLNDELRGSKSDDALEPEISPELLFQRQNPRKRELRESRDSPPSILDELVDSPP
jgi:hypothetical protein